jgi:hypothetical protein
VNVTFGEAIAHHLGVQVIQDSLDLSNTSITLGIHLIHAVISDEVE